MFLRLVKESVPALLLLFFALACSGCEDKGGVKIGDTAPAISSSDLQNNRVELDQLKGNIVVIFFWTNSCCGDSIKELEPLYRRMQPKGLRVLAVNEIDSKKDVAAFAQANQLSFTMLTDEHSTLLKRYRVMGFPTIFILDRHGIVREKILGNIATAKLEKLIERQFAIQKQMEADYEKLRNRGR